MKYAVLALLGVFMLLLAMPAAADNMCFKPEVSCLTEQDWINGWYDYRRVHGPAAAPADESGFRCWHSNRAGTEWVMQRKLGSKLDCALESNRRFRKTSGTAKQAVLKDWEWGPSVPTVIRARPKVVVRVFKQKTCQTTGKKRPINAESRPGVYATAKPCHIVDSGGRSSLVRTQAPSNTGGGGGGGSTPAPTATPTR